LGLTVDAVRSRIKRRTIDHVRVGGRVYVLLGADEVRPNYDHDTDQETRESEDRTGELIATLREQLQAERKAHAEARRLLAAALERIPAIEAPLEASETADEQQGSEGSHSDAPGAPEAVQRPWWRRLFGG
jgi:flagellar motility protein MotE (MotC chaperone)